MKKEIQETDQNRTNEDQNYDFINKDVSKFLSCPKCHQLMKNPMRIHACGHTFCDKCAPSKGKCPSCKTKIVLIQRDLVGQGLINQLHVKCLNQGCVFKGSFQDYKKLHQGKCKLKFGLDQWMESMKNSLQQMDSKKKTSQKQNQFGLQKPIQLITSKQTNKIKIGQKQKIAQINWDDQPFSKKQLRKQI